LLLYAFATNFEYQPAVLPGQIQRLKMLDAVMLAMGLGFFLVALPYVSVCDRL